MSSNPEPDFEKEFPLHASLRKRFIAFAQSRPVAFSFRIWLAVALFSALMLSVIGLEAFSTPSRKLILLIALLGWVIPFADWIRAKKMRDE